MARLTEGRYPATVYSTALGELDNDNKTPYLLITFEINRGAPQEEPQGRMSYYGWMTENSAQYTADALRALGWDPKAHGYDFGLLDMGEETPIKGAECEVVLQNREMRDGDDKPRLEVRFINSAGGSGRPKHRLPENRRAALFKSMQSWDAGGEEGSAVATTQPPADAAAPSGKKVPW